RLACHVTCFKLSKSAADAEGWLTETIQTIPNRALRELATSVAPLAMEALQRGFYGRRILTTLAPHISKLKTMVMLNEAVAAVGYTLEDLVQDVVDPTCIGGAQYLALNLIFNKIRDGSALGEPMSYYDITEKVAELLKPEQEAEETTVAQVKTATEGEIDNGIEPAISTVPGGNAQVTFEEASSAWSF
ncbi:MAG: hypothetical protein PHT60_16405, partial [Acidiphilium sp.]|nr:hypothetical protein [Acidiphilium sp.]